MSDGAHLLIPYAHGSSEGCAEVLRTLALPHLEKLAARLTPGVVDAGTPEALSPPHERALARAYGLHAEKPHSLGALERAIRAALSANGPTVIEMTPRMVDG